MDTDTVLKLENTCQLDLVEKEEWLKALEQEYEKLMKDIIDAQGRLSQLSVECQNMKDKISVCKLKAVQEENLFEASKAKISKMKKCILEWDAKIECEEQAVSRDIDDFETEVDLLSITFRNAGVFYGVENLLIEKSTILKKLKEINQQKKEHENVMSVYKQKIASKNDELNSKQLHSVLNMFKHENHLCKMQFEVVKSKYSC